MKKKSKSYFVHPQAIVEETSIGSDTRIWAFAHVMKGAHIGAACNIGDHCFVEGQSFLGDRVTLKNGVSVWNGVVLEDDVFVGPNAVFTNDLFPISRSPGSILKTRVKKGTCIGANATIVCGVQIGRYAFVGAGSVVTRDVPDYALSYGNPAKVRRYLCQCRKKLTFINHKADCACGLKYHEKRGGVTPTLAFAKKKFVL